MTGLGHSRAAAAAPTVLSGIGLGVLGFFLFSGHDALIKWLVAGVSVWQILFFRCATILVVCVAVGRREIFVRAVETPYKGPLVTRGVLLLVAWLCFYTASADLQLAELTTIYFGSPVLVTILAVPFLGERVGFAQWIAVLLGFAGVLVAVGPGGASFSTATALALIASVIWSCTIILLRRLSLAAGTFLQIFFTNAIYLPITAVGAWLTWTTPDWPTVGLLVLTGVIGGLAQMSSFEAIRRAPASILAPFEYTALIWAFVLGFVVWGDVPRFQVFVGAGMILTSGLVVLLAMRRRTP